MNMEVLEQRLIDYRNGEEFDGSIDDYIENGLPDERVLERLKRALEREREPVRVQVVELLSELGRATDPMSKSGGNLISHRGIIALFVKEGIAIRDEARNNCLEILLETAPVEFLKDYAQQLVDNCRQWPDPTLFLIIGKAKLQQAKPLLDEMSERPDWQDVEEFKIAVAALGDENIEAEFIGRFRSEKDPEMKEELARKLGYIGTPNALKALGEAMRTELIFEIPNTFIRSVRLAVVEALSFNYPRDSLLYVNKIRSDEDYAKIEQFCSERFGVKYTGERPAFLTIQGFPSEPVPEN